MSTTPTPSQLDNAHRLADGLEKVAQEWPERFDMSLWFSPDDPDTLVDVDAVYAGEHPQECGTVACAVGWAPYLLGIPLTPGEIGEATDWVAYAKRLLGLPQDGRPLGEEFLSLFGGSSDIREDEDPDHGAEGALAAARRLRAWADAQVVS